MSSFSTPSRSRKGGGALHDARHHALRALEVLRRADVDERRLDDHAVDQAIRAGPAARRGSSEAGTAPMRDSTSLRIR